MKLATWNVNSIRARHATVFDWLERTEPDVFCMQETKVVDDDFPTDEFLRLGYAVAIAGQKSYNGVALASRLPMTDVAIGLYDEPDPKDKRLVRATIDGMRIYSAYVPNGKSVGSPTFEEKIRWYGRLRETLERETTPDKPAAVCGDFNVAPADLDVYDPVALRGQLHFHPREHEALAHLKNFGLEDVFRKMRPTDGTFSWWDYRAGGFQRNLGLRIDFILATHALAERCKSAEIDLGPRHADKPSDHTPVIAIFE